ncbi:hypothetical protein EF888_13380 [Silicimonas algicola]|uniref:Lipoprotein n=1 Tax=Silicimonas algicola TaxID=1826607 RepID=A0A316G9D9_9RHOB|nr:hypothetical protein [Silicimonas algicola]AZQ68037.1 hypothetical protein EF888_13380 [Silicimonas algicola]PWK57514.1 hypothetical protein C8D95_102157 [Silicimonas algicola]
MKHVLLLFCLALAACAAGPTKRLTPGPSSTRPLSALHIAGETTTSRTVVQIVSDAAGYGLSVHVGRSDGHWPSVERAMIDGKRTGWRHVGRIPAGTMLAESGVIALSTDAVTQASGAGMTLTLCGASGCETSQGPAGLFKQALVE